MAAPQFFSCTGAGSGDDCQFAGVAVLRENQANTQWMPLHLRRNPAETLPFVLQNRGIVVRVLPRVFSFASSPG
jgi:hypothetical protein